MKVLVTGGAGYVGAVLCKELLKDHEVVVYDLLKYGLSPIIQYMGNRKFNVIRGDVKDTGLLFSAVDKADAVIHLAALVGAPLCDAHEEEALAVNATATRNLAIHCRGTGKKLIYASTGSVYGKLDDVCREESALRPLSTYGLTKAEGEEEVLHAGGLCLRFATLFGVSPSMRFDLLLHDIIYQAIRNKCFVMYQSKARRTFLSVKDAADSYIWALNNYDVLEDRVFNVGSPDLNLTKKELADKVSFDYPFELICRDFSEDPDQRDYEVSYDKIVRHGWRANHDIESRVPKIGKLVELDRVETKWRIHI